jgi:predicted DNA-binding protein with PD1-like motif
VRSQPFSASRFIVLRLDPGEDVLLSLRATVKERAIRNAAILSGVGSLDRYHFHVVQTTQMPPGNTFVQGEGPFDILTVTGLVVDGDVHAHITFSNTELAMGGHLEEGCRVLTFAVVVMAEALAVDLSGWDRPGPLSVTPSLARGAARR